MGFVGLNVLTTRRDPGRTSGHGSRCIKIRIVCSVSKVDNALVSKAGKADLNWDELGFAYVKTKCFVKCVYKDGQWGEMTIDTDPYVKVHIGATALHYGQSCFEGMKAFTGKDGQVRLFRVDENAKRLQTSTERMVMPEVPTNMFVEACKLAVRENIEYAPPYGFGGSLYVRPLMFGSGARVGLQPADEYTFVVLVTPVGDYYKGGLSPVTAFVQTKYDRAAPQGIGDVKVGANYAADILPFQICKSKGYPINLYLHPKTGKTVEEFGTSNFIALKGDSYVTPDSPSVLPSITNKTLMHLAAEMGMQVERRPVTVEEIADFDEVAACGTAVVITPVTRLVHNNEVTKLGNYDDQVGPRFSELYRNVRAIQNAEVEDRYGWTFDVME